MGCLADKVTLSPLQKQHYESVRWLFDETGPRQQGRSYLMAIVALELALEHPGNSIKLRDHCPPGDRVFADIVARAASDCSVSIKFLDSARSVIVICRHCGETSFKHADGKCLFEASCFTAFTS